MASQIAVGRDMAPMHIDTLCAPLLQERAIKEADAMVAEEKRVRGLA